MSTARHRKGSRFIKLTEIQRTSAALMRRSRIVVTGGRIGELHAHCELHSKMCGSICLALAPSAFFRGSTNWKKFPYNEKARISPTSTVF